ncbi:MAG TPA: response regulator [Phycisphaerae bacterium]|nr:response regulator [Phycisphaerales bacterium]HRX83432.1 response regulator [Phycisphaerae bacterium]
MTMEKILLVERNPRIIEMLVEAFVRRFDSQITCVSSGEDALDVEIFEPHAIAVVDTNLDGIDALTLAGRLCELSDRPVILTGCDPTTADVIEALRMGVADFFVKPYEIDGLLNTMAEALSVHRQMRARVQREERTRRLLRKVIRERRALNERVELICRDLVGAHKRLATRVLARETQGI